MVNEEKVLRMTKMAVYEEKQGKKDRAVAGYFRSDYISVQMILSFLVITAAFFAGAAAYICFHFEALFEDIYSMDLMGIGRTVITLYLAVMLSYLALTWLVYAVRYRRARKRLNILWEYLDRLDETEEEF